MNQNTNHLPAHPFGTTADLPERIKHCFFKVGKRLRTHIGSPITGFAHGLKQMIHT